MRVHVVNLRNNKRQLCLWAIGAAVLFLAEIIKFPTPEPIRQGNSEKPQIALCCNVFWGEEYIPEMLKILDDEDVKITFFIGGTWARDNETLLKEIANRGHVIANHSYNHPHPNRLNETENIEQIKKTEQIIEDVTGKKMELYAPPYGEYNDTVLKAAADSGYRTILWSLDTVDWKKPPPESIVKRIVPKLHNGAIILLHPTANTCKALPIIIREAKAGGYSIEKAEDII